MKRVARFFIILAILLCPLHGFAQNEAETIQKIDFQLQNFDRTVSDLKDFSDNFFAILEARKVPDKDPIYSQLLLFDAKLIDTNFKLAAIYGVLKMIEDKNEPVDPIISILIAMLPKDKPPLEFVKDMLPIISNSLETLKREKQHLENTLKHTK